MVDSIREGLCFVLIHGTRFRIRFLTWLFDKFKRENIQPWFYNGSPLPTDLHHAYPAAVIKPFEWDGWNSQRTRYVAVMELLKKLEVWRNQFDHIVVIGHSHGGNVALQAIQKCEADNIFLITLGTPFLHVGAERSVQRIAVAFVLLYSIILFSALGSFIYFANFSTSASARLNATVSLGVLTIAAALFCLLFLKLEIHKTIATWLKRVETQIRMSYKYLELKRPIKMLPIRYGSDEVLTISQFMRRILERIRYRADGAHKRMGHLSIWWDPLLMCGWCLVLTLLWVANVHFIHSIWMIYALAVLAVMTIAYFFVGLVLFIFPFFSIYFNEVTKYKFSGLSITTLSPTENILISCRSHILPVGYEKYCGDPPLIMKAPEEANFHHGYICYDPKVGKQILIWLSTIGFGKVN